MTISEIFDAFQQVNGNVSGIKSAPNSNNVPTQLSPERLPAAITWYAGDDWGKNGETDFVIEVYVAPVGSASPTSAMATCLTLAQRFRDTYRALNDIGGFPIRRSPHSGRGGFGADGVHKTMGYAGAEYFGFSFRVPLFGVA